MNNANLREELLPLTSLKFISAFWDFLFRIENSSRKFIVNGVRKEVMINKCKKKIQKLP